MIDKKQELATINRVLNAAFLDTFLSADSLVVKILIIDLSLSMFFPFQWLVYV